MPILRQDPTTKEWVIFATERAKRPHDFIKGAAHLKDEAGVSTCPFCPGNESETPPPILTLPGGNPSEWSVRVFPNRFAALGPGKAKKQKRVGSLYREMDGIGRHEVIVETQEHDQTLALMEENRVLDVLKAYKQRYESLTQDPSIKVILIFKNHGESAGTSLKHSHSQLVATPVVPKDIARKNEVARSYYDKTGMCLYSELVREEMEVKERVILQTDRFVVFHPYASRFPFETWIAPKEQEPAFGNVSDAVLADLAQVLKSTLWGLYTALDNPDYNYIIHSGPVEKGQMGSSLWYIQIIPRLTKIAGFELGSGTAINTTLPEETAEFMRRAR